MSYPFGMLLAQSCLLKQTDKTHFLKAAVTMIINQLVLLTIIGQRCKTITFLLSLKWNKMYSTVFNHCMCMVVFLLSFWSVCLYPSSCQLTGDIDSNSPHLPIPNPSSFWRLMKQILNIHINSPCTVKIGKLLIETNRCTVDLRLFRLKFT